MEWRPGANLAFAEADDSNRGHQGQGLANLEATLGLDIHVDLAWGVRGIDVDVSPGGGDVPGFAVLPQEGLLSERRVARVVGRQVGQVRLLNIQSARNLVCHTNAMVNDEKPVGVLPPVGLKAEGQVNLTLDADDRLLELRNRPCVGTRCVERVLSEVEMSRERPVDALTCT